MAQLQRQTVQHWNHEHIGQCAEDVLRPTAIAAPIIEFQPQRRVSVFLLSITGLGGVIIAALSGIVAPVVGILAAGAIGIASLVKCGFWILDNVVEF